jgi:multiple sugar transport system permease protein
MSKRERGTRPAGGPALAPGRLAAERGMTRTPAGRRDAAPTASSSAAALGRRRARRRAAWRRRLTVLSLLAPWLVGLGLFFGYPLVSTAYLSFTHYDLLSAARWIGLGNYRYMGRDPYFWPAVRNSLWMICIATPLTIVFAFCVAQVLTKIRRGAGVFRTVFYLPTLVPPVAATLGFLMLLRPSGAVDRLLGWLQLPQPLWFDDPRYSKPALTLLGMWGIGSIMIIFLASLLDVPADLYEAAEIDGANAWHKMRYVTLPTISPVILFAVVTGVIDALQYFTQGYVASIVAGGQEAGAGAGASLGYPLTSTLFFPYWLYQQGFQYFNMGYAAAMSVVLFGAALVVVLILLATSKRWVHTAGGFR